MDCIDRFLHKYLHVEYETRMIEHASMSFMLNVHTQEHFVYFGLNKLEVIQPNLKGITRPEICNSTI